MTIFFPLDQTESAAHERPETLLATRVYERLTEFIDTAVSAVSQGAGHDFQSNRRHNAALIDGPRGSGKSSVLVNLSAVLHKHRPDLHGQVHILKPVDPTLLEDGDDLFLNVIVAAVLADKTVKDAQQRHPDKRTAFQRQLQRLGQALEYVQSQRSQKGLDKIRSFVGNHQLVEEVHLFFKEMLDLLDKKMLVLAIDDVDTSLDRAFENLEVVRRYLTTPLVLPILSGDLGLYHDVTWRAFHSRLQKESTYARHDAYRRAGDLAHDYQRKVLPLQYRLPMPEIGEYLRNPEIELGDGNETPTLPLPSFCIWLDGLLNGTANGLENSEIKVPIENLRALAQLVYRTRSLIPALSQAIVRHNLGGLDIRRALVMPQSAMRRPDAAQASPASERSMAVAGASASRDVPPLRELAVQWYPALREHFRSDPLGGPAYLVFKAFENWGHRPDADEAWFSALDASLFQPLRHADKEYEYFQKRADLQDWHRQLKGRAPEAWLERLPLNAILAYPVPEVGFALPSSLALYEDQDSDGNLLLDLLVHRNFYSTSQRATLVCIGRIVELLLTSLIADVSRRDIVEILQRAPFYSFSAIAATKTVVADEEDASSADPHEKEHRITVGRHMGSIEKLAGDINAWRAERGVSELELSPWLIYCVINKVITQAWIFNKPRSLNQQPRNHGTSVDRPLTPNDVLRIGRGAFNSVWAAFGSFEKGRLFGLQDVVAYVNIGAGDVFERSMLHTVNIAPFLRQGANEDNRSSATNHSVTRTLQNHPLLLWIDRVMEQPAQTPALSATSRLRRRSLSPSPEAKRWLKERLAIKRLSENPLPAIKRNLPLVAKTRAQGLSIAKEFRAKFPADNHLGTYLLAAAMQLTPKA